MPRMPESSSPLVSAARAVPDAGKSGATVSGYSERFLHRQTNIKGGLGGGLVFLGFFCVCLFALDSLIFLILDLMLHCKIYRDHKSYKPLEGQKRPALMHAQYRGTAGVAGEGIWSISFLLVILISLFIVFVNCSHNPLNPCLVSQNEVNPKLNLQRETCFWFWFIQRKHHS